MCLILVGTCHRNVGNAIIPISAVTFYQVEILHQAPKFSYHAISKSYRMKFHNQHYRQNTMDELIHDSFYDGNFVDIPMRIAGTIGYIYILRLFTVATFSLS